MDNYQKKHITIVDDISDNLSMYYDLLGDFFDIKLIQDPNSVIDFLSANHTDLILLDVHMPEISGFDLYEKINKRFPEIAVIFLSSDSSEDSMLRGLNLGADDFILKPVSLKELIARIENKIFRRQHQQTNDHEEVVIAGPFTLKTELQLLEYRDQSVFLTPIEYKLMQQFMKHPNQIFSREFLTTYLWPSTHVQTQNMDTHMSNLRKKLGPLAESLKTIKSKGYILRV